jgi:hypothetical protein
VYDPATLDLSIVQFGVTTGFDVNGLLIQGGGSICASLDVNGAPFLVVGPILCWLLNGHWIESDGSTMVLASPNGRTQLDQRFLLNVENDQAASVALWPNPAVDVLNVRLEMVTEQMTELAVFDVTGKEVIARQRIMATAGENLRTVSVDGLQPGQYFLRVVMGDTVITERFSKTGR